MDHIDWYTRSDQHRVRLDLHAIQRAFEAAGVEFIDENRGGPVGDKSASGAGDTSVSRLPLNA